MIDVWGETITNVQPQKVNKKKIIIAIIIAIIVVTAIITIGLYNTNKQARTWIDKNIFRKEIQQDKAVTIEIATQIIVTIIILERVVVAIYII